MNGIDTNSELQEFLDYFSDTKIPDPDQYPKRFEFMVKSFQHYKKMKEMNDEN